MADPQAFDPTGGLPEEQPLAAQPSPQGAVPLPAQPGQEPLKSPGPGDRQAFDPSGGLPEAIPDAPPPALPGVAEENPFKPLTPAQEKIERARLHYEAGNLDTMYGSSVALAHKLMVEANDPLTPGFTQAAKDHLEKIKIDQLAYNAMRPAESAGEYGVAIAGHAVGGLLSYESFINPFVRGLPQTQYALLNRVLGYGAGGAAMAIGTDPVTQAMQIRAGVRTNYDWYQTALSIPLNAVFNMVPAFVHDGTMVGTKTSHEAAWKGAGQAAARIGATAPPGLKFPDLVPELTPHVPPLPDIPPNDIFKLRETGPAVDVTPGTPAAPGIDKAPPIISGLPEPPADTTRLYRREGKADSGADHFFFTKEPFEGATEFIDVPTHVAESMTNRDRVLLPAALAEKRQKIEAPAAAAKEEPNVFEDLAKFEEAVSGKTKGEKQPQTTLEWIRSMGGLKGTEPEIRDLELGSDVVRPKGKKSMTAERVLEAGVQQKRFPEGTTLVDLYKILGDESAADPIPHYHPGELDKVKAADPRYAEIRGEVATAMDEINPTKSGKQHTYVRQRAAQIMFTEENIDPTTAVERAIMEYGEHARARAGSKEKFADATEVPFDTEPAPRPGGAPGEPGAGVPGRGGESPGVRGVPIASEENDVAARLKSARDKGGALGAPKRPDSGIASANVHTPGTPIEGMQSMMTRITHFLGIPMRKGTTEKGAAGQFDFLSGIARINEVGPKAVQDWAHEIGHYVEKKAIDMHGNKPGQSPLSRLIDAHEAELKAVGGDTIDPAWDPPRQRREAFGEFTSGYVTNRANLANTAPDFTKKFRELMAIEDPQSLHALDSAQHAYETYKNAPSMASTVATIRSRSAVPQPPFRDPLNRGVVQMAMSTLYRTLVDSDAPLKDWVAIAGTAFKKMYGGLMDLPGNQDPRIWKKIFGRGGAGKTKADSEYGVLWNLQTMQREPGAEGLSPILQRVYADATGRDPQTATELVARRDGFNAYLVGKWVKDLYDQMDAGIREMSDRAPTSWTRGDAEQTIREAEQLNPHWRAEAENIYKFNKDIVRLRHSAGLISRDEFNELMDPKNWQYVPLLRDLGGMTERMYRGGTFGEKGLEILNRYKRVGSDKDILSPIESILQELAHVNDQALENMPKRAMRDIMQSDTMLQGKMAAVLGEEIPSNVIRARDIQLHDTLFRAFKQEGLTTADAKMMAKRVMSEVGNEDLRVRTYISEPIKGDGKLVTFGWEGGERFAIQFPDTAHGEMMVNLMDSWGPKGVTLHTQGNSLLMDILSAPAKTVRFGATATFTFAAKNLIRDSFASFLLIPEVGWRGLPFISTYRGFSSILRQDEFYRMHMTTGGIGGGEGLTMLRGSSRQAAREFEKGMGGKLGERAVEKERIRLAREQTAGSAQQIREQAAAEFPGWFNTIERNRLQNELETLGIGRQQGFIANGFDKVQDFFRGWVRLAEMSEHAGRINILRSVVEAERKMGRSEATAIFNGAMKSRDFVDYNTMGSRMEGMARAIPFLNANIQGLHKFFRVYGDILFRTPITAQEAAEKQMLRMKIIPPTMALAVGSVALSLYNRDDPVYQRMSTQTKSQYWIIRVPIGSGTYFAPDGTKVDLPNGMQGGWIFIPKPFEAGTLFSLAELAAEFLMTKDPQEFKKMRDSIGYSMFNFLGNGLTTIDSIMNDLKANHDTHFDRPIIPQNKLRLPPHMQSNENTGDFYKMIAEGLNLLPGGSQSVRKNLEAIPIVGAALASFTSPMESQYLMRQVFGDMPRELGGIQGIAKSLMTAQPWQVSDVPGLRAFYKDKIAMGDPMQQLFSQVQQNTGELTVALNGYRAALENGDKAKANYFFKGLSDDQRDYIRVHQSEGGPITNVLHPADRGSAMASVVRTLKNALQVEGGFQNLEKTAVINIEAGKRDVLMHILSEYEAAEARNGAIVQGLPGYKNLPIVNTKPLLDQLAATSPQLMTEFTHRMGQAKVMPIETIQKYWPELQKLVRIGAGENQYLYKAEIKTLAFQAATENGYEGGGKKAGRGAVGVEGERIKRGKTAPTVLPPEPVLPGLGQ